MLIFSDPSVLLFLAFCIFTVLALKLGLKPFLDMIQQYQNNLQTHYQEAEQLLKESEKLLKHSKKEALHLREKINQIQALTHHEIERLEKDREQKIEQIQKLYHRHSIDKTHTLSHQMIQEVKVALLEKIRTQIQHNLHSTPLALPHDFFDKIPREIFSYTQQSKT